MRIFLVVGYSGSGKTYLIEKAIRTLSRSEIELGVLKHIHYSHPIDFDRKGKDTWRFYNSGASMVMASHRDGITIMKRSSSRTEPAKELLKEFMEEGIDCVFVEGFYDELKSFDGVISVLCATNQRDALDLLARHSRARTLCVTGRAAEHTNRRLLRGIPFVKTDSAVRMIQTEILGKTGNNPPHSGGMRYNQSSKAG